MRIVAFSLLALFVQKAEFSDEKDVHDAETISASSGGNIIFGAGYSEDTQQVTQQRCFNATISSIGEQQAFIKLGEAMSFTEMENTLEVEADVHLKIWFISVDAKAQYMRSLQDKEYALSLNYYYYASSNVALKIPYGENALNEVGKAYYANGTNPYFGVICGNQYIDSYEQGALLTMGLNIELSSSVDKKEFTETAGGSFSNIISASETVKKLIKNTNITGSVTVQAYQMGGDPGELTSILSKDASGNYNALSCSLRDMDNCIKTASGLLDYATTNFRKQISFKNDTGLTPLGIRFTDFKPVELLGLKSPVSLAPQEVLNIRTDLFDKVNENEYYQRKFHPFFNGGYPVNLTSEFLENARSVLSKAELNLILLRDPVHGVIACYNLPYMCRIVRDKIYSQLMNITEKDLSFMENIRLFFHVQSPDGSAFAYNNGTQKQWHFAKSELEIQEFSFTKIAQDFLLEFRDKGHRFLYQCYCKPRILILPPDYECRYLNTTSSDETVKIVTIERYSSPYYFLPYKNKFQKNLKIKS